VTHHERTRHRAVLGLSVVSALMVATTGEASDRLAVKRLFAPPEAVLDGSLRLPDPAATAVASTAALRTFPAAAQEVEIVHGGGPLRVLPIAAPGFRGRLWLERTGRPAVASVPVGTTGGGAPSIESRSVALDALGIGAETALSETTLPAGPYRVTFAGDAGTPVFAAFGDGSEAALVAHRDGRLVREGETLAIRAVARRPAAAPPLEGASFAARALAGAPLDFRVESARVRWSDGTTAEAEARVRSDGSILLSFPHALAGDALVEIDATVRDGRVERSRSVALLVRIAANDLRLAGAPSLAAAGHGWLELSLPVSSGRESLVAATELWAVGDSAERCLGWLGGIAEVEEDEEFGPVVRLGLAASRLDLGAAERLECRQVRFHERDGFATLEVVDRAETSVADGVRAAAAAASPPAESDWMGRPGVATVAAPPGGMLVPGPGSHAQVLMHGYCADGNPFPLAQFGPDAWAYEVPDQNLPNDAFALDLRQRTQQFKSFGTVAHSQGGLASLHLYTFYFSGLDWAGPGRLVQAVGAPFEGTPIAGVLAALGSIFGVQCGANYDMTPEGAAIWLSTIPPAPRARVFTFTTSYSGPGWSGYCSLATALFLAYPEDGVTEHASGHFPGANDLGLTYGWCHVGGMRDPDQALDANRNAAMREAGAR
jgi:hypothetical protein